MMSKYPIATEGPISNIRSLRKIPFKKVFSKIMKIFILHYTCFIKHLTANCKNTYFIFEYIIFTSQGPLVRMATPKNILTNCPKLALSLQCDWSKTIWLDQSRDNFIVFTIVKICHHIM